MIGVNIKKQTVLRKFKYNLSLVLMVMVVGSWLYAPLPAFLQPLTINQAQAASLTAYLTSTNDTLVTTARQLTSSAPASETSVTVKVGKSTNWGELLSQGSSSNWPGSAAEPSASGKGFLWDVTTLEGQQILAGNWTPTVKLKVSVGSIVADVHARAFVRSSSGVYTQIIDAVASGKTINTTATAIALTAAAGSVTNFNTGDKLYIDVVLRISSSSTGSNTATVSLSENGGASEQMITPGYQLTPVTTLADGSNPGDSTIAPGASATDLDAFTLSTNTGTDTVTGMTVTLSTSTGISQLDITNSSNSTQCTTVTNPSSTTVNFTGCSLAVTTGVTTFKIRLTPQSHANMPAPPGGDYAVTGTVTALTTTNSQSGTDSASATITIDNSSPADVGNATTSPSDGQLTISWTNPADSDFSQVVVLRSTSSPISDVPTEGASYSVNDTIGSSIVQYVGSATSTGDSGLTDGVTYYYKIFTLDNYGNYSTPGVQVSGVPAASGITISGILYDSDTETPLLVTEPIKLAVASTTAYVATTSPVDGSFVFNNVTRPATGTVLTLWLTGGTRHATTALKYGEDCIGYPNCQTKLYLNHVRVNSRDGSVLTNADLNACDNTSGSVCSDSNIGFVSDGTNLQVTRTDEKLRIAPEAVYNPGGSVTAEKIVVKGVYAGSNTLTLTGSGTSTDCTSDNSLPLCIIGTFDSSSTDVTFTATSTTVIPALNYHNLTVAPTSTASNYTLGSAGWYNSAWSYRKAIIIDHTQVASSSNETYNNFPVLINLSSDSNLASSSLSSGNDILFTAADGITKLNYERESYSSSTGQLLAWVQVPNISTSTDTTLYMYYGNANSSDQSNKTATWDSSYKLVYHLPDGSTLSAVDSTANANNGNIASATAISGQVGGAAEFDGSAANIKSSTSPFDPSANNFTVSAWFDATNYNSARPIAGQDSGSGHGRNWLYVNTSGKLASDLGGTAHAANSTISAGQFNYGVLTKSGTSLNFYYNGNNDGSFSTTTESASGVALFGTSTPAGQLFFGALDELRFSNSVHSADWIKTEYNNQYSPSTFYSLGMQEASSTSISGNLTVGDGSHSVTLAPAGTSLKVLGNLNIVSGTLDVSVNNPSFEVDGSIANSGNFNAPSGTLTLKGNFTNNGTFVSGDGTVAMDLSTSTVLAIGGNTNFNNFSVSSGQGKTLSFKNGSTIGFAGTVTLSGADGQPLAITSDSPGSQWVSNITGGAVLSWVNLKDTGCAPGAKTINVPDNVADQGDNGNCWSFIHPGGGGGGGNQPVDNGNGGGNQASGGRQGGGDEETSQAGAGSVQATGGTAGGGGASASP